MLKVKGKYIGKIAYGWAKPYNILDIGMEDRVFREICRHLSDNNPRDSPGYDGVLRELFETIMFQSSLGHKVPDGDDRGFSAFRKWFDNEVSPGSGTWYRRGTKARTWFPLSHLQSELIYILDNGMMGRAKYWCEVGDEVFLLRGADCPFVLRRNGANYRLVGPAYVHRLYQAQPWRFDGDDVQTITLV